MQHNSNCTASELTPRLGALRGALSGEGVISGTRGHVLTLQSAMLAMIEHQIQIDTRHHFADGLYIREATLPEGTTAVGHIHAKEHVCIISKGRCLVVTEDGTREIAAPATMIVPAGRKNCVHALTETVWATVHATAATTVEDAERTLILPESVGGVPLLLPHEKAAA